MLMPIIILFSGDCKSLSSARYNRPMKREWLRLLLVALACFLLGSARGSSRLDRLTVAVRDFVALYERTADLDGMSVNDRIRFREMKRELERLARESGP